MRFLIGLFFGVSLGATIGLMMAPQPGSEMRQALQERIRRQRGDTEEESN